MEFGECSSGSNSSSSSSDEAWAKLVPSDSRYSDVEIRSNEMVICSEITSSSLEKHEWCKITRNSDQSSAMMQNKSSNTILVDEVTVQNEDNVVINCGSEIIPGPAREGYLSYRFKLMPRESFTRWLKVNIDAEHAKCSICLNVWHDVVTVAPCLHNFCNGCFSEWLRRSQKRHSSVLCPQCRAVVLFVGRNHFLHSIEEDVLQADSSLKQSDEEIILLDSYASIKSNLIIQTGKKRRQKRPHSILDAENEVADFPCPQCGTEYSGFHCNQNTIHLQCHACGGMMPSRADIGVPQHCLGCDRVFCGAYWHAQGVSRSDSHCSHENFKPISEHAVSRIPFLAHEKNRHEQDITQRCIRQMGKTLQDVISDWIGKLNNREIDRTRMPLNHAEMITVGTHVCNDCYDKLISFLLYWFRISIPKNLLPPEAADREDCWYGYACRTQHHNEDHARKRNHVCRPARGNHA
ncbi:PREDICTED: E3 ubiquitin-protein ligase CHFR [Populus euphratica]|uniref:E3 ubiquitin-protein ligase CHFR n=1 Tax=Populus euphratica TaxID=75702 RepID=A0AAJ6TBT2_POPEU|nr:PREDICTED: E3 ubiquitin-protein ligase CHFR [Populus euphratica]